MNATMESYVGSARREALDHIIALGVRHLRFVLSEYVRYFKTARSRQGLGQRVPATTPHQISGDASRVVAVPVLGGLYHDHRPASEVRRIAVDVGGKGWLYGAIAGGVVDTALVVIAASSDFSGDYSRSGTMKGM